jgi:general stress protein 26
MQTSRVSRPYMPGYGVTGPDEGTGLLPWSWAESRLVASHDYWVATTRPDGRPHLMPVWGAWLDGAWWFSSSLRSRKARNIEQGSRVCASTDNAYEPVVLEGPVERIVEPDRITTFLATTNEKYDTSYEIDFLDPGINATYRIVPDWVFALTEDDFSGSPTRWASGRQ